MKKITIILTLLCVVAAAVVAIYRYLDRDDDPQVSTGTLERYEAFPSRFVEPRDVTVWLPDGYRRGDECDVLYMHDGQMLFDSTTTWNGQEWMADEILGHLIAERRVRPTIVVAIDNTADRLDEYFPTKVRDFVDKEQLKKAGDGQLLGDRYLQFIVKELKPFVDSCYTPLTTRDHTVIMGSSMGGLISLYAVCEYPQVFGRAACLSSHLSFAHLGRDLDHDRWAAAFCDYLSAHLSEPDSGTIIYMDRGTEDFDADYGPYQSRVDSLFNSRGWDSSHYQTRVFGGHRHRESSWARRLDQPLLFILANR